ncbi:hypothetical protein KBC99_02315 [Candidatus Saccharibacteria bacterium]|nr:hypothetical protein [Candidatus Saccharibacteria bacterium]
MNTEPQSEGGQHNSSSLPDGSQVEPQPMINHGFSSAGEHPATINHESSGINEVQPATAEPARQPELQPDPALHQAAPDAQHTQVHNHPEASPQADWASSIGAPVQAVSTIDMTPTIGADSTSPSGRWQTFWFALSVVTLGWLLVATNTVTSTGTLEKLLLGFKPHASDKLFGARLDIILANSLLGLFLICLPIFIIATIKVDQYKVNHPNMQTSSMKVIAYVFMVLTALSIITNLAVVIFELMNYTFNVVSGISLAVGIIFSGLYFAWLYLTVAEDRKR